MQNFLSQFFGGFGGMPSQGRPMQGPSMGGQDFMGNLMKTMSGPMGGAPMHGAPTSSPPTPQNIPFNYQVPKFDWSPMGAIQSLMGHMAQPSMGFAPIGTPVHSIMPPPVTPPPDPGGGGVPNPAPGTRPPGGGIGWNGRR